MDQYENYEALKERIHGSLDGEYGSFDYINTLQTLASQGGGILSDRQIIAGRFIEPMAVSSPKGVISYGVTSYGYDMRISNKYKICLANTREKPNVLDPKNINGATFFDCEQDALLLAPHGFALGVSVETFTIPRSVLAICVGKSTYARCGIVVNVTPLEPEWRGKVTIEISNTTDVPAIIYSNEGIAQVIFIACNSAIGCAISYADKNGRYQDQTDITLPFVRKDSDVG